MKQTMDLGWMAQLKNKNKQIQALEEQVKRLKQEVEKKDLQLQARVQPPLEEPRAPVPSYFEPMETHIPTTRFDTVGSFEDPDYTISGYTLADPRERNPEKELKEKMQQEVDAIVKECMHWESRIIHSACITYLTPEGIHADYHMPTLPYPLLKQEVQYMKKRFLQEFQPNELGGYANVPISDYQVADIEQNQPTWRITWMKKNTRNKLPQELRIDPTFYPIKFQCNQDTFQRVTKIERRTWLNYPEELPEPRQGRVPIERTCYEITFVGIEKAILVLKRTCYEIAGKLMTFLQRTCYEIVGKLMTFLQRVCLVKLVFHFKL